MENQLYIPNQVLSSVSKENADAIKENVLLLNKLVTEFYDENKINMKKAEHIIYMLMILEKIIYHNKDAIAELTKIQIIRSDILRMLKEDPETSGKYRSNLLYPITKPEVTDTDLSGILEATLCSSADPLIFKDVKDMVIPPNCIIFKMYTNSDFYYYDPNKGFVGTPVAEKAVTEALINRTQYIKKVQVDESSNFDEGITMEIIGEVKSNKRVPVFFILNDSLFSEMYSSNELYTSRYNLFSILPKDFEFKEIKQNSSSTQGVLSDLFAKKKLEELFTSILIKREKIPKKIAIVNTLTEIFLQKINKYDDLVPESRDKVWNKPFFYSKQHIYMLYLERILGVIDNARGITSENVIKSLVNMISSDDTSNLASIMSELKK